MSNNSAFDAIGILPVVDVLENQELLDEAVTERLEGEQAYKLLFDTHEVNARAVAYQLDAAPGLDAEVKVVPEFGEIPVADPLSGEEKFAKLAKDAVGIRVSYEQRSDNDSKAVQREVAGRSREIARGNARRALAALDAAEITEFPVTASWDTADAKALTDLHLANELIVGAQDKDGNAFDYEATVLWVSKRTASVLKRNEEVSGSYIGDMASENPLFKSIADQPLLAGQFQIAADNSIPDGVGYLFDEGRVGSEFQIEDPIFTPFYEEGGQSGYGGPTMSWRSDYVHERALAVRAPKAIVKLTGLLTK